jgi:hypothetical protein
MREGEKQRKANKGRGTSKIFKVLGTQRKIALENKESACFLANCGKISR